MVKFSHPDNKFERDPNDFYRSFDKRIHKALSYHIEPEATYVEPCAGFGDLIIGLNELGIKCVGTFEKISRPNMNWTIKDAMDLTPDDVSNADYIITNPPWTRSILHPMIEHFANLKPTWLIFEADWAHTIQSIPYMDKYCTDIVSVGRLIWQPGTKTSGTKDCAWYKFDVNKNKDITFHPRRK